MRRRARATTVYTVMESSANAPTEHNAAQARRVSVPLPPLLPPTTPPGPESRSYPGVSGLAPPRGRSDDSYPRGGQEKPDELPSRPHRESQKVHGTMSQCIDTNV